MDAEAVIRRHPETALIDELAHTNVPGVHRAKRWEDVLDILASGIEVISTLNIQHIESLNDVVAKATESAAGDGSRLDPGARRPG